MTAKSRSANDAAERKLMLLDVYALVYRAFFALPPLTRSDGTAVNAVYGFERMLASVLKSEGPTHVAACFDAGIPAERLTAMPTYKANRPDMPDELRSQFPLVRRVLEAYGVTAVECEGEEADDCIATLADRASKDRFQSVVVSGDMDLLQLVDEHCTILAPKRGMSDLVRYDEGAVYSRYGLRPDQLADYRGLKGDPSDNLSGVPGIGEKTAAKLIAEFGTLDDLLARASEVKPERIGRLLVEHADLARRCRDVSLAKRTLDIKPGWERFAYAAPERSALIELYRELEFRTLLDRTESAAPSPAPEIVSAPRAAIGPAWRSSLAASQDEARGLLARAAREPEIAIALVGDDDPDGIAVALPSSKEAFIAPAALLTSDASVRAALADLLQAPAPTLLTVDAKRLSRWAADAGFTLVGLKFDATLAYGLLDADRVGAGLADIAAAYGVSGFEPASTQDARMELFGSGVAVVASQASAAAAIAQVAAPLRDDLANAGMTKLFDDVELPLAPVLASMERAGFRLDLAELDGVRHRLDAVIDETTIAIHRLAGESFNINSPKVLGVVLFEKLGIAGGAKKKTGWGTGIEVLGPLAAEHEIVRRVLDFREASKLKSTYVDALPASIDARDGRLHTTFDQLGAATGRLSSNNPNLQNIPVRSEIGRGIRRAFLAPTKGRVLLAADYSQIELRLFAHLADDPTLIEAFASGEDIHAYTARRVFDVPAGEPVPSGLRRRAKAVNFGVLYGMGSFGLAQAVGLSRGEAREFIASYFARFPMVKDYIARSIAKARVDGYVATILGRRRYLPGLKAANPAMRATAERIATNAPLQGSAADLIKLAMLRIANAIERAALPAQMLLQVHDELIFEVEEQSVGALGDAVREAMEHALDLRVPLVVDLKSGPTWGDIG